jgi:hypothetical protein
LQCYLFSYFKNVKRSAIAEGWCNPAFGRLKQEDFVFAASLGYFLTLFQKTPKKKKKKREKRKAEVEGGGSRL